MKRKTIQRSRFITFNRAFQQTRRQAIEVKPFSNAASIPAADMAGARLLVATDQLPEDQLPVLQEFLADGGTVLFVMKNAAVADRRRPARRH